MNENNDLENKLFNLASIYDESQRAFRDEEYNGDLNSEVLNDELVGAFLVPDLDVIQKENYNSVSDIKYVVVGIPHHSTEVEPKYLLDASGKPCEELNPVELANLEEVSFTKEYVDAYNGPIPHTIILREHEMYKIVDFVYKTEVENENHND
ncbi:MAG: hypothetical protein AB7V77_00260 [Candidatus Woesearchaeota archaeon]